MPPSTRQTVWLSITALGVMIGIIVLLNYQYAAEQTEARMLVQRSYKAVDGLRSLLESIVSADAAQRAYLLTHSSAYLARYHATTAGLPKQLGVLTPLVSATSDQQKRLDRLTDLLNRKIHDLEQTTALYEGDDPERALDHLRSNDGNGTTRRLSELVGDMVQSEQSVLEIGQKRLSATERGTLVNMTATGSLSLLCIALLVTAVANEMRARRRVAENLGKLKREAEVANRTKAEFIALMSHELRSPLTAVMGFAELLQRRSKGQRIHESCGDYAFRIERSAAHLLDLVNDILDFSKLDAGQLTLYEEKVPLAPLLQDCIRMVMFQSERTAVSLRWSVDPETIAIYADPKRLRQIVINLLANAIKYTPPGGAVTVDAACDDAGALALTVSDTGIGIAEADMPKVLQPFVQIDNARNRQERGTGLGLPLTKRLVEMHGGTLELHSAIGRGTSVIVRFPGDRIRRDPAPASR